ncbi:MAG: NAD-dependent epimerase/dehydratase family protein [Gemmatimonadetes bacterium]|nr:NAD-dependent epimerase/dehydratase family protein [Gemmatimonadota bacterium]MBT8404871.1 NAD-dependent epimerase/dehydratase family protein [Gemmatimonadota bacterium]NNK62236.1 NAD-dependent epimerase/dehydratase family protein [Gemmatimonadota bacterium]
MNVLIFGATGMIGSGVLQECLDNPLVTSVRALGRSPTGRSHPKLDEIRHTDFFDYAPVEERLRDVDVCFFCLGVSAAGMSEADYHRMTCDLTLGAAESLLRLNPESIFCYVSGAGTDSTEQGRWMWARVKGKTENALLAMPFRAVYNLRPGYIQPMKGVRSKTRLYAVAYGIVGPLYPLLRRLFPSRVTDSVTVGRAMIRLATDGFERGILEGEDINRLGTADV